MMLFLVGRGGSPPLGYDVRDRKLVVNPAEADLVRADAASSTSAQPSS
jgi:hypothetical protein